MLRLPFWFTSAVQLSRVAVGVLLSAACGIANAQPVAAPQSAVPSRSDRFDRFVPETAPRFGIPAPWIKAVMQAKSRGAVRTVSAKGASMDTDHAADMGGLAVVPWRRSF